MAEFEITERTEAFTLDEVFSFIDETNIGKTDTHELKSRIADAVKGIRAKAIDEFAEALRLKCIEDTYNDVHLSQVFKIAEQMKGEQNG